MGRVKGHSSPQLLLGHLWSDASETLQLVKHLSSPPPLPPLRLGEGGKGAGLVSDVELVSGQVVHEWLHQEVGGEVEDQSEGDGDGQRWEGLPEDGQQQQRQTQALDGRQVRQVRQLQEQRTRPSLRSSTVPTCPSPWPVGVLQTSDLLLQEPVSSTSSAWKTNPGLTDPEAPQQEPGSLSHTHTHTLTMRMATKQARVVFQSPPVAAAFPTRTL